MRFVASLVVHVLIGVLLATGIVLAAHGTFWLLLLGAVAYLLAFIRFGCSAH